ncbi:pyridine nucleotide-disulfide oxidoreductase [Polaribacter reichenbachii]|uniref:Pyridine nucleotide-disulfide oxidoreductase n=1 Tax=Polaribacter reichenbachii TaxID=996801 RepID=A0A1B8TUV9_9FLAO|nr:FAD-dependent oxidoreductase [Polaribacter reichenbachii]APZ45621.1 pyridine nucleotide-disulfide oxidoreductase [Polaribacter reichenbachii]AUC19483.1 pyridine nucleotide-disulfide oxidoreductase [Polaribacter reichenbachii]OBY63362.1 pyridine nucleotide-disulfide oxidoreductase [Polaribacter reichenbachii]
MILDCLIIGGGVSGMQCALVLGSAKDKPYTTNKKISIIMHQKASHLENALFNNVLGLSPKTLGKDILVDGKAQLTSLYPHINQLENEKVISIDKNNDTYIITTNKEVHYAKIVVLALNYSKPFTIKGLDDFLIPHKKANPEKDRIQLKNKDHCIKEGLYCCGTIAGHRSQFAIASGSGASVATDILTIWNNGNHAKVHDKSMM